MTSPSPESRAEYERCACCGSTHVSEDGMYYRGRLVRSQKTCRNSACALFEITDSPEKLLELAAEFAAGRYHGYQNAARIGGAK